MRFKSALLLLAVAAVALTWAAAGCGGDVSKDTSSAASSTSMATSIPSAMPPDPARPAGTLKVSLENGEPVELSAVNPDRGLVLSGSTDAIPRDIFVMYETTSPDASELVYYKAGELVDFKGPHQQFDFSTGPIRFTGGRAPHLWEQEVLLYVVQVASPETAQLLRSNDGQAPIPVRRIMDTLTHIRGLSFPFRLVLS